MAWTSKNNYLTANQSTENGKEVFNFFHAKGWKTIPICAMLGNMYKESQINPGIWQNLTVNYKLGFGLTQWTPATKYLNWAKENGLVQDNGDSQCQRIQYELDNNLQYAAVSKYPLSFKEFTQSDNSLEYLVYAFFYNYEKGNVTKADFPLRLKWAKYFADMFADNPVPDPEPEPEPTPPEWIANKRWLMLFMLNDKRKKGYLC